MQDEDDDQGNAEQRSRPGERTNSGGRAGGGKRAGGADTGDSGEGRREEGWADDLRAVAEEAMGSESFQRLAARAGDVGGVADVAIASHLDDLRLVEKARFQRARRDAGRALALGDKQAAAAASARVAEVGSDLAFLRLQRDVASRQRDAPDGDD